MVLERGFFLLALKNIGAEPAVKVVTKIGGRIVGPDGKTVLNDINLFKMIEFFAPGKEFRVMIGSASAYFASDQPTTLTAAISYSDEGKNEYAETIIHDLAIYRDLPHPVDTT